MKIAVLVVFAVLDFTMVATAASHTDLKRDEQLLFYPTIGHRSQAGAWQIEIRGCIYEPEKRGLALTALREALDMKDVEMSPGEEQIFNERARLFLADHERGKRIFIRISDRVFPVGKSKADGYFTGGLLLSDEEVRQWREADDHGNWRVYFAAELSPRDTRQIAGEVLLLDDAGLSVISDIDDTIKITEVLDRYATLRNTFLREFQPAPGMATFYQNLARSNHASFHYVSASPCQLYVPLAEFVRSYGFPTGTFHLKDFRWKDQRFLSLFASPEQYKAGVIEPLLKRFPNRRFVLIGDSGERDPEIYAALARKFPQQVEHIHIRDVTGETAEAPRYRKTFRALPPDLWTVFREPPEQPQ